MRQARGPLGFEDRYGRVHDELRISVTDRCNLRCAYCMPEEPEWFPREEILTFEEIGRLARVFLRRGVSRFRITGGEPLVRRDVPALVRLLAGLPGVDELSLTTNGVLLPRFARELAGAGLHRVNVSLDTLRPERFRRLTRRDGLEHVLEGLDLAPRVGLGPVKVNCVLLRGVNDDEILPMTAAAREGGWELRFIEFMPLENGGAWSRARVVPGAEVKAVIESTWPLVPDRDQDPRAPATRFHFADGGGAVGFINSVTAPFCAACSRLRITSDGVLTTCLYARDEIDLKTPLRTGREDRIEALIERGVLAKGRGGALHILERRQPIALTRTMHQIGG